VAGHEGHRKDDGSASNPRARPAVCSTQAHAQNAQGNQQADQTWGLMPLRRSVPADTVKPEKPRRDRGRPAAKPLASRQQIEPEAAPEQVPDREPPQDAGFEEYQAIQTGG